LKPAAVLFVWSLRTWARDTTARNLNSTVASQYGQTPPHESHHGKICRFPLNPTLFPLYLNIMMRRPVFRGWLACFLVEGSLYLVALAAQAVARLFKAAS